MSSQYGAHLSYGAAVRPSVFEVLAQENLALGLRTALKYVAHFGAQNQPAKWGFLYKYADEIILALEFLMQYHHLKKYNASFAERFYGLAREGKVKLARCLLLLSLLPYLRSKLEQLYQDWKLQAAEHVRSRNERPRNFYIRIYPYLHFFFEGSYFALSLLYALGKSNYHSIPLFLSGTSLEYFNRERHQRRVSLLSAEKSSWYLTPLLITGRTLSRAADHATTVLMTGAFLLQFLEWWYQNSDLSPLHRGTVVPPSPTRRFGDKDDWLGLGDRSLPKGICPLCKEAVVNETVLATSGLAFCYSCILKHLLEHNSCPVTGYPTSVEALIQVYK
ncbi:hypothetical protein BIW11_08874 [Tropilaelaps mercedesae]|uniref:Peroxisome assembly protein 12 n=1 Tax=Tropilaelaps mercedesae TaxID=418985 RepID=A0A1V9XMR0_9ACAR|nr:hypothetical protein BIW11_08874 [Tropilaelaps mercedesae]